MKKALAAAFAVAAVAASSTIVLAGPGARTGINGSMHDINAVAGYADDSLGRTCVFCHTPHNARTTDLLVPLWNHADNKVTNMSPYTWVAPTNKGIAFAGDPLIGPSRLCMACHDGVTAVDSHGTADSKPVGTTAMTASYTDGLNTLAKRYITDLTVTHPIGFQYDEAATKRNTLETGMTEIIPSSMGFIADSYKIDPATWDTQKRPGITYSNKKIKDTLYAGWMTCATCHDVHNSVNSVPDSGHSYNYFLYAQEEGSKICLSCHVK